MKARRFFLTASVSLSLLAPFCALGEPATVEAKPAVKHNVSAEAGGVIVALVALLIPVLIARFLYKQKVFIRL